MFETLYRVDPRGRSFANPAETEYYQPRIDRESHAGRDVFLVRETHGYFDDEEKKAANITSTLSPEEGFATFDEANSRYEEQLRYRAKTGFVHVFSFDPFSPDGMTHRVIGSGQ
jgi:hypothetical protein